MKKINEIKGFEGVKDYYYITEDGKVISTYKNKIREVKQRVNKHGYAIINLRTETGGQKTYQIHRIVAIAFIPNEENKPQVDHINSIKIDNRVENLRWATPKENMNNETSRTHGKAHWKKRTKEYYKTHAVVRDGFKTVCKNNGWAFDDFEETYAETHVAPNGRKRRKYFYA